MKKLKKPTNPKKPLRSAGWEKFAQGLARGLPTTQAYMEAGYTAREHSAEVSASRLWKNIDVAARVDELRCAVAELVKEKRAIEITDVIDELVKIGFANMGNYFKVTPAGDVYIDLSQLTPDHTAAIGEVTMEEFTVGRGKNARKGRRTKIKLLDKRAALVNIGKHLGGFVERNKLGDPGDLDRMDDIEICNRAKDQARELLADDGRSELAEGSGPPRRKPH